VDDPGPRGSRVEGRRQYLAPHRVEDKRRPVLAHGCAQLLAEVALELHGRVGSRRPCLGEPLLVPAGGHDPAGSEEPRGLNRHESDRACRAEHEHRLPLPHRRTPCEGEPPGKARDPERAR